MVDSPMGKVSTDLKGFSRGTLEMVITRADGTVEDLGVVARSDFAPKKASILTRLGDTLCRRN